MSEQKIGISFIYNFKWQAYFQVTAQQWHTPLSLLMHSAWPPVSSVQRKCKKCRNGGSCAQCAGNACPAQQGCCTVPFGRKAVPSRGALRAQLLTVLLQPGPSPGQGLLCPSYLAKIISSPQIVQLHDHMKVLPADYKLN